MDFEAYRKLSQARGLLHEVELAVRQDEELVADLSKAWSVVTQAMNRALRNYPSIESELVTRVLDDGCRGPG